jgi:pre-rRNA-processing protein TSR4
MMAARVVKEVELGFVEEAEDPEQLTGPHFPSKVGGKPAWLDNAHLPRPEDTECSVCRKPMTFLLQVYAPVPVHDSAPEGAEYHRTMFVFMCRNPGCHSVGVSKSFKVLQCRLEEVVDTSCPDGVCADVSNLSLSTDKTKDDGSTPALNGLSLDHNSTASELDPATSEPSKSKPTDSQISDDAPQISSTSRTPIPISQSHLCIVCGCSGPKRCGRCMQAHYCSKEHQTRDWKAGHKRFCEDLANGKLTLGDLNYDPSSGVVLPEYEIVTELEPDLVSHGNGEQERSEEERMADYYKYIESGKCGERKGGELSTKALKGAAKSEHNIDKQFRAFKKRVAIEPEQVRVEGKKRERMGGERLKYSIILLF